MSCGFSNNDLAQMLLNDGKIPSRTSSERRFADGGRVKMARGRRPPEIQLPGEFEQLPRPRHKFDCHWERQGTAGNCAFHAGNNLRKILSQMGYYDSDREQTFRQHLEKVMGYTEARDIANREAKMPQALAYQKVLEERPLGQQGRASLNRPPRRLSPMLRRDGIVYHDNRSIGFQEFDNHPGLKAGHPVLLGLIGRPQYEQQPRGCWTRTTDPLYGHAVVAQIRPKELSDPDRLKKGRAGSVDIYDSNKIGHAEQTDNSRLHGEHGYYDEQGNIYLDGDRHSRYSFAKSSFCGIRRPQIYVIDPERTLTEQQQQKKLRQDRYRDDSQSEPLHHQSQVIPDLS